MHSDLAHDLLRDLGRITAQGARRRELVADPGAWAVATYRVTRSLRALLPRTLAAPLRLLLRPWRALVEAATTVQLADGAEIGAGLYLSQPGAVCVAPGARLGRDVHLCHGARIEATAAGAPFLGDRVYVGPGACVRGPVRIGNDVAIAAHGLVERDLPDGAVVAGAPATVLSLRGSHALVVAARRPRPLADAARAAFRRRLPRPFPLLLRP